MFGMRRGDFRFLVLTALSEKPMHGYALIQEIGKTYQRPVSAGLIYPKLQELEDRGYVSSEEKDGKKTYSVTAEGKKCLEENKETVERLKAGREYADKMGRFGFMKDLHDMRAMVLMNDEYVDDEKMKKIQGVLSEAKKKMAAIVFE
jgi:DNA-binding PadR family transcriptional regulator